MKKMINCALFSLTMFDSSLVCAADYQRNECTRLHIQIANMSGQTCLLTDSKLLHGNALESPPMTILPGRAKRFDVLQSFYGPDLVLTYQCGDRRVIFESQQNACVFWGGQTHAKLINKNNGINVQVSDETGSFLWNRPGMINCTITDE